MLIYQMQPTNYTLNCNGRLLVLDTPIIMGILNSTPDSFFDGGKYHSDIDMLKQVEKMLTDGASIIDIGGYSTRPNAAVISEHEELNRVLPIVKTIHQHFPSAILSIDTFRSKVAEVVIQNGVSMVNDISGGTEDEHMFDVVAQYNCPFVIMHKQGNVQTMHNEKDYQHLLTDILDYFVCQIQKANNSGIKDVIIDVGFGFSKTMEQNYYLLKNLEAFNLLDKPMLVGVSRKSMLYKLLEILPANALNATTAAHMLALQNGANILRVHDVKEAIECVKIWNAVNGL